MRILLLVVASIVAFTTARAEPEQVRRGPAPAWVVASAMLPVPDNVSGPVFIRRQDLQLHLSGKGQAQYLSYRIKILQPSALQLGNISVVWNPAAGSPIVHEIKLYREDQVTDVLKNTSFEVLRREDQLEAAKLDGRLTAVLRVPDLRVGDELEVGLTIFASDPTLGSDTAGLLVLAGSPSPGRYRLGLNWDQGYEPRLKMTADMTAAMQKGPHGVDFRFDNPAVLSSPKDAPMRYQWQRAVEYSRFADWPAISSRFAPLYAKAATPAANSPLKREAARIAAAHPRPLERAGAALKLVQQDVRYIYVGLNGGNLTPTSAEETWQRRYGDCKAKTALLLALLSELGIEAEAALVNSDGADDGLDERLPSPQFFDHVLVRARIEAQSYWLDGTLPPVAAPSVRPVFQFHWYLPLRPQGGILEKLDWRPPITPDEINLFEIDAHAGFDKPARITSTAIARGVKGLQQYAQYSTATPAQMLEAFRQQAVGDVWQAIEDVQWRYDEKAKASILKIAGTGIVSWEKDDGGAKSLALPGGGFSPPERRVRAPGQYENLPYYTVPEYICHVTTVRLPNATQSKQWSSKPSYDTRLFGRNYYRAWELRDGSIRMIRGSRIEQPEIDAATAQRDNGRIAAFDNSMGYIFYNPLGGDGGVGKGEKVPATYDIDWTSENVPCLSSAPSSQIPASLSEAGANDEAPENIWLPTSLYPPEALRTGAEGTARVRIAFKAPNVDTCALEQSSGSPDLDKASCQIIINRLPFALAERRPNGTVRTFAMHWQKNTGGSPNLALSIGAERWIDADDYPLVALRKALAGVVRLRLEVSMAGKPEQCEIVESSDVIDLDTTSYRVLMERGHFLPSLDGAGKPQPGMWMRSINWTLPK